MDTPRVVIIGAGTAGLNAARTLKEAGWEDFTVLEAQDVPGGRTRTQWIDNTVTGGYGVDLGAMWIHGNKGNPLYEYVKQCGLKTTLDDERRRNETDKGGHTMRKDGLIEEDRNLCINRLEDGTDMPDAIIQDVEEVWGGFLAEAEAIYHSNKLREQYPKDIDMRTFLEQKLMQHLKIKSLTQTQLQQYKMVLEAKFLYECTINGCDNMQQVSTVQAGTYDELRGEHPILASGYSDLVNTLVDAAGTERILCNKPVATIEFTADECTQNGDACFVVRCSDGSKYRADHVICTVSLGVLQQAHKAMFVPALPHHYTTAISSLGIDTVDKIYLVYDDLSFFPDNVADVWFYWRDESNTNQGVQLKDWCRKVGGFQKMNSTPENVLLAWVCGEAAAAMEEDTEEEVMEQCVEMLRRFLGHRHVPTPRRLIRSRWHSNKYTQGSYTYIPTHSDVLHMHQLATPVHLTNQNMLIFAGEATHPSFYSTVHGAFQSGERAAKQIMKQKNCR